MAAQHVPAKRDAYQLTNYTAKKQAKQPSPKANTGSCKTAKVRWENQQQRNQQRQKYDVRDSHGVA